MSKPKPKPTIYRTLVKAHIRVVNGHQVKVAQHWRTWVGVKR